MTTGERHNLFRLDGKVAVVTGSSRGIGKSIVTEMARAGAKVVVSSRRLEACEAVRDMLRAEGLEAMACACHAGRKEDLERLIDQTLQAYGRIDICVSNVGVNPKMGSLSEINEDVWDKIFDTNLKGTWLLANLALPHMANGGGGSFIIISSIAAFRVAPAHPAYNISKRALLGLAQNLAYEWGGQNIRVNAIAPGLIKTELVGAVLNEDIERFFTTKLPLRRVGEPQDICAVALFLASPAAAYITGQTIIVDGGFEILQP
jgi:dehydrogenase/reductase SDR family protein 4